MKTKLFPLLLIFFSINIISCQKDTNTQDEIDEVINDETNIDVTTTTTSGEYIIVHTGVTTSYNNTTTISTPSVGDDFYGQDANYIINSPSYTDNGDGTITDNRSGLIWQKSPDTDGDSDIDYNDKMGFDEALSYAQNLELAGSNDWRLPSIKELYSLIMFYGEDPSGYSGTSTTGLVPFINTNYFDFAYGNTNDGERIIDAQMISSTEYVHYTMNNDETVFGVNFADGRIKGYPKTMGGSDKVFYVYCVRGNTNYGLNNFQDNGDGTITDNATGLMWMQDDNGTSILWENALSYAENFVYAGYNDWRLPNAKELQSLVDYSRSPATTSSPATDLLFNCTSFTNEAGETDYGFYWSSTTHNNMQNANNAAYVSFGRALGYMSGWIDVHGAGAQRSDPKTGDPGNYPTGHGPQGDAIRIYNYVRLVRTSN